MGVPAFGPIALPTSWFGTSTSSIRTVLTADRNLHPRYLPVLKHKEGSSGPGCKGAVDLCLGLSNHRTPQRPADGPTHPSSHTSCIFHCESDAANRGTATPPGPPSHSVAHSCAPRHSPSPHQPPIRFRSPRFCHTMRVRGSSSVSGPASVVFSPWKSS